MGLQMKKGNFVLNVSLFYHASSDGGLQINTELFRHLYIVNEHVSHEFRKKMIHNNYDKGIHIIHPPPHNKLETEFQVWLYMNEIIIIPFPQKGNGILFLCGFIFAIIITRAVVVVVVKVGQISLFF